MRKTIIRAKMLAVVGTWLVTATILLLPWHLESVKADSDVAPVFSGYSTGTGVFVDLLKDLQPALELANVNAAFSGAAADTSGLKQIDNEMSHAVVPADIETASKTPITLFNSYGRGSGLEVGLGTTVPNNPDLNQLILAGLAEQAASPPTPPGTAEPGDGSVHHTVGPVPGDPLAYADLLTGQAKAQYSTPQCIVDPENISFGRGDVAQVELINTAMGPLAEPLGDPSSEPLVSTTRGQPTENAVSSAKSRVHLVPNGTSTTNFGLMSETSEDIAPVTLFKGTANEVTIEVAGEWSLQALATGDESTSSLHYGPTFDGAPPGPTMPLITITPPGSAPQIVLKTQDLFGPSAAPQHIFIPPGPVGPYLAEISIGEDPRAIGDDHNDTPDAPIITDTEVSGAVDVVRITLLGELQLPTDHVAEIRIGHMESKSVVPSGGVNCPGPSPTSTPTLTPAATNTPSATSTPTPSGTGTPSATATPGGGGTPTRTPGAGRTPTPSGTGTPSDIGGGGTGIGAADVLQTTGSGGCALGHGSGTAADSLPVLAVGLLLAIRQWRRSARTNSGMIRRSSV